MPHAWERPFCAPPRPAACRTPCTAASVWRVAATTTATAATAATHGKRTWLFERDACNPPTRCCWWNSRDAAANSCDSSSCSHATPPHAPTPTPTHTHAHAHTWHTANALVSTFPTPAPARLPRRPRTRNHAALQPGTCARTPPATRQPPGSHQPPGCTHRDVPLLLLDAPRPRVTTVVQL